MNANVGARARQYWRPWREADSLLFASEQPCERSGMPRSKTTPKRRTSTSAHGRGQARSRDDNAATIAVKIDPVRKARYERLRGQMRRFGRDEAEGFDAFWEAVAEIVDSELYVMGGF